MKNIIEKIKFNLLLKMVYWCEPYSFWEYLFSKHFDVLGLIDKGLAIDISSLGKVVDNE